MSFLVRLTLIALVSVVMALTRVSAAPVAAQGLTLFEQQVVDLVNQRRAEHGLPPLRVDGRLVVAARTHNNLMMQRNELSHQLSGEKPLCGGDDRYGEVGYPWTWCGENIAAGQRTPDEVVNAWMNSPGHRANILHEQFRDIGVAHATGGGYGHWWTQNFGLTAENISVPSVPRPVWAAEYGVEGVPRTWSPGHGRGYTVAVRNTGNTTWPAGGPQPVRLGVRFARTAGGFPANVGVWLNDTRFSLPRDVRPGETVSVHVQHDSPAVTHTAVLEFQLVKEGEFWFGNHTAFPVQIWAAEYGLNEAPTTWVGGQAQSYQVRVRNAGNVTWPAGGDNPVRLGAHFATTPGGYPSNQGAWITDTRLSLPRDVPPGGVVTVAVSHAAPETPRGYVLEFQAVKEGEFWFGRHDHARVVVNAGASAPPATTPTWAVAYAPSRVPTTWWRGQTQSIPVVLRNTGNTTWNASGANPVRLGVHFAQGPGGWAARAGWHSDQRFRLPQDVRPGESVTVYVTPTAPQVRGAMVLEFTLVKEYYFWFQQSASIGVVVN